MTTPQRKSTSFLEEVTTGKPVFCRDAETALLRQAFEATTTSELVDTESVTGGALSTVTQFVVLEGPSGVGKTALAHTLKGEVERAGGYFVTGKFDRVKPEANYTLSWAFGDFLNQVQERGPAEVARMQELVRTVVGEEVGLLVDVVPELEDLLGPQEDRGDAFQNSDAEIRFKNAVRLFVNGISTQENPVVLFWDDVHWADMQAIDLLVTLLNDASNLGTMVICAINTDEVTTLFEEQMKEQDRWVRTTRIPLAAFDSMTFNKVVAGSLQCPEEKTESLSQLLFQTSQGNIYFAIELLRKLHNENLLVHDSAAGSWTWEMEKIQFSVEDVETLMEDRLKGMAEPVKAALTAASAFGSFVDEDAVSRLVEGDLTDNLKVARQQGFISFNSIHKCYQFTHDSIKDVVYGHTPEEALRSFHLDIGRKLWKSYPIEELSTHSIIFDVTRQLILGADLIDDQVERIEVAGLCLHAGVMATSHQSFLLAAKFFSRGVQLLGPIGWTEEYDLCLQLHNNATEAAYSTGDYDAVYRFYEDTCKNAKEFIDTLTVQTTNLHALGSNDRIKELLTKGVQVLKDLGHGFSRSINSIEAEPAVRKIGKMVAGLTAEQLYALPTMEDHGAMSAMHILNIMFPYAYLMDLDLFPKIGCKMVELTMEFGLSSDSCIGLLIYSILLCGVGNDIDEGYRYGRIALELMEEFQSKAMLGRVSAGYYGFVHGWKRPITDTFEPVGKAYPQSLAGGDTEFAMFGANVYLWNVLDYWTLKQINKEIRVVTDRISFYGREMNMMMARHLWQFVQNLMGKGGGPDPKKLIGSVFDERSVSPKSYPTVYQWCYFYRMLLCYFLGDYDTAWKQAQGCEDLLSSGAGHYDIIVLTFYEAMTALAMAAKDVKTSGYYMVTAERRLGQIKSWANHSPANFLGKQYIIQAELAALRGENVEALKKFVGGIALSREAGLLMQTALAHERAGKFCVSIGDKEMASRYLKEAVKLYQQWGSKLKSTQLEEAMKDYLT